MKNLFFLIFTGFALLTSCRNAVQEMPVDESASQRNKDEALIKMNNYVAKRNRDLAERFVMRNSLDMKETGSGLWYGIYFKGNGPSIQMGNLVELSFKRRLLDGTPIDSASAENAKTFRVGKGGVESGLEEAVLLLHLDDSARLIIPPHLAHGNFEDQEKFPPGAFLFYDLCVVGVKP